MKLCGECTKFYDGDNCPNCSDGTNTNQPTSNSNTPLPHQRTEQNIPKKKRGGYLKVLLIVLAIVVGLGVIIATFTSGEDTEQESLAIVEDEVIVDEEVIADEEQPDVADVEEEEPEVDDAEVVNIREATVEERVLVDENNVRITLTSMSSSWLGEEINLLIENDNDHPITIQVRNMSVNGLMIDFPVFSPAIAAGMRTNDSISITSSEIEDNAIKAIGIVELQFIAFEDFFGDYLLETDIITIETSMANQINQRLPENKVELFNQDGIIIYHTGYSEGELGEFNVRFFIVNHTHELITVQAREESVNGFMIMGAMSADIMPDKATNTTLGFFSWDLEDNNIDTVETISFYLYIIPDWDFMRDGIQTEIITLTK